MPEITQKLGFDAQQAITNLTALSGKINEANQAMRNMKKSTQPISRQLSKTDKSLKKTKKSAENMTISWQTMVRVIQTQIIVRSINLLNTALQESVERARQLGLAIEEIQTISGRMQTSEALSRDLLNLSAEIGKDPLDLAEGYYQTLSNQVGKASEAFGLMSRAAKLATITGAETGDAINALSSVINAYNMSTEQAEHVSGTLFATIEQGRLRLSDIADTLGRVTPLTAELGISWEETAAAIATMTRQGVRADTAITQLRAVVSRLIKPTDQMREIFHKWGVEDGEQAIKTFGGLRGVLAKFSEETGGSSTEMAKLLRRVRAITGQLGIMSNEGETITEVMVRLQDATKDATEQWEIFAQSDAQRYTRSVQELENTMTNIGHTLLPAWNWAVERFNERLEAANSNLIALLGGLSLNDLAMNTYYENQKKAQIEIDARRERAAERERNKYKDLTQATNQYYAEIGKEELRLADIRDKSIEKATKTFDKTSDTILDTYEDNIKQLERFISRANDEIRNSTERIADLQRDIDKRVLENRLEQTQGNLAKLRVLEESYHKKRMESAKAFQEIDSSEASKERALALLDEAQTRAEIGKRVAEQAGLTATAQKYEQEIIGLLKDKQQVEKKYSGEVKKTIDPAKEELEARKEGLKTLENLFDQVKEIRKEGLIDEETTAKKLDELGNKIASILGSSDNTDIFLKSLGLERSADMIQGSLKDAFREAEFDWTTAIQGAKAAFAREIIPIKIALDPTGIKAQIAERLGLERGEEQTRQAFTREVNEAAIEELERTADLDREIKDLIAEQKADLKSTEVVLKGIAGYVESTVKDMARSLTNAAELRGEIEGQEEAQTYYQEQLKQFQLTRDRAAEAVINQMTEVNSKIKEGGEVERETTERLREKLEILRRNNQLSGAQFEALSGALLKMEQQAARQKEINALKKQLPENETVSLLKEGNDQLREQTREQKEGVNMGERAKETLSGLRQEASSLTGDFNRAKLKIGELSTSADGAATNVSRIGTNASGVISSLDAVVQKMKQVQAAAQAAAAAQAQVSGGAAQYYGGPMKYFAAGGTARGQDKISTMLSKGETVINSKASKKFFSELNAINQGSQPVYREQGGSVTNVGDVNVTVNGGDSSQQTVREIGHALRREIKRGNIKLH